MKLLKITAEGLALFKDKVEVDFFAEQRVYPDNSDMVFNAFGKTYTNNVIALVGINASGKTSLLKLISFIMELLNGSSINNIQNRDVLTESQIVKIETFFYDEKFGVCKLFSKICKVKQNDVEDRYIIQEEKLWSKKTSSIKSKKDLTDFKEYSLYKIRDNSEEYLQDDTSIAISISKKNKLIIRDLVMLTNINLLGLVGDYPHELIDFLDPSIEQILFDKKTNEAQLRFYGKEPICVNNPLQFEKYLSSGTVKGINVFINAMMVFEKGGYLIVDELENHFNREIVATLVRFFMNSTVNKNGATLIFSTHYSELLDEIERNDNIFVIRNRGGIFTQKLSKILKRNDIKKSEVFKSDFLEGTVPSYESYMKLKKAIINSKIREV